MQTLDERDTAILNTRQAAFLACQEPKQGDFIRFADGTIKRIAHVWPDEQNRAEWIQPTDGKGDAGSFYLGEGYMSYSGSLNQGIDANRFTRANETMQGRCWFFHHDFARANGGVYVQINCPVWNCDTTP